MKLIDENFDSLKMFLYNRVKTPLSSVFICTWLFWNWKMIYVSFFVDEKYVINHSGKNINRIQYIDLLAEDWSNLLINPIISTIFILIIYPFISIKATEVFLWHRNRTSKMQLKKNGEEPASQEQYMKLLKKVHSQEKEFTGELLEKDNEVNSLKSQNRSLLEMLDQKKDRESLEFSELNKTIYELKDRLQKYNDENNDYRKVIYNQITTLDMRHVLIDTILRDQMISHSMSLEEMKEVLKTIRIYLSINEDDFEKKLKYYKKDRVFKSGIDRIIKASLNGNVAGDTISKEFLTKGLANGIIERIVNQTPLTDLGFALVLYVKLVKENI